MVYLDSAGTPSRRAAHATSPKISAHHRGLAQRPPAVHLRLWRRLRRAHLPAHPGAVPPTAGARENPVRSPLRGGTDRTTAARAHASLRHRCARDSIECVVNVCSSSEDCSAGATARACDTTDQPMPIRPCSSDARQKRDREAHFLGQQLFSRSASLPILSKRPRAPATAFDTSTSSCSCILLCYSRQFRDALCSVPSASSSEV